MAFSRADFVQQTTNTTGTGTYSLSGSVSGRQDFLDGNVSGSTVRYSVTDGANWEVAEGLLTSGQVTRATVIASSNSGAAISWSAGDKFISQVLTASEVDDLATESYVDSVIAGLVDSAPETLDTLNELAAALGDDPNFATTTATSIGEKLAKASNLSDLANAATARTNLGLGTAATTNSTAYATAAQGTLADSALQSGDNISELTNDSSYITGNQTITLSGDVSGSGTTNITVTVADDSHNHIISNVDGLQAALDGKVDDSQVLTNVPSGAVFTDTTYSVGNGGLTEINFTSALNSKLAGIEAGATADQTASEILTAVKTVDGSGSGLDADLLDGQQGSYYAAASSLGNYLPLSGGTLTGNITLQDDNEGIIFNGGGRFYKQVGQGLVIRKPVGGQELRFEDNSGTFIGTFWHSGNDGSGSGLDADLLDGQQGTYYAAASSLSNYLPLTGGTLTGNLIVDINGTAAGLVVNSNTGTNPNAATIDLIETNVNPPTFGSSSNGFRIAYNGDVNRLEAISYTLGTNETRLRFAIDRESGDASFYADDGTTQDFYWDASASSLGIGTTSPATALDVSGVVTATGGNSTNWNTAYGWGNHASAGYLTGNQTITLSGDVSGSGTTSINVTVANDSHSHSNYLPKANNSDYQLQVWDNRNADTSTDLGLQAAVFEFKANSTDSLSDGGTYHGVLTLQQWSDSSGGNTHQLAFTDNGNLHLRSVAIGGTWPTNWSKLWHSNNDGSGSGLDADLLDGQQGSYYVNTSTAQTISGIKSFNSETKFGSSYVDPDSGVARDAKFGNNGIAVSGGIKADGLSLGDNDKATFGASDDLQIYHDGSNSYIREDSTGSLRIQGADLELSNPSEIKWLKGYNNNRVELFYNNSIKLSTTSAGIDVTGSVTATGNVTAYSDRRLKDNIQQIEGAVEKVQKLSGNTYTRNDLPDTERRYAGVIAQEVEAVLPEAVSEAEDGTKTVDYNATIALLIEAVKELKAEVDELKGAE